MKKYHGRKITEIETVKDLKKYIKNLPDNMDITTLILNESGIGGVELPLHITTQEGLCRDHDDDLLVIANAEVLD